MPSLPPTPFAGDSGACDEVLGSTLRSYGLGEVSDAEVLRALVGTRVLVPILARATAVEADDGGNLHDKNTDMEVVLWKRPTDGRVALLAFTSLDALRLWDPQARPSPVTIADAARVAIAESASALLIDVAGPVRFVVETADLTEFAAGHVLVAAGSGYAWIKQGLR